MWSQARRAWEFSKEAKEVIMNSKIERLLKKQGENYIFPFLWLHGEDEETLRKYMKVIDESNIKAVCVESRPHPDYCGSKWWKDMDIILDEARKRNMKVWILDDSHFPTGFANGMMANQPDELCRQSICCKAYNCIDIRSLHIGKEEILHPEPFEPTQIEQLFGDKKPRQFDDDRLLALYAIRKDEEQNASKSNNKIVNLQQYIQDDELDWSVPEGKWTVYMLHLSRNKGYHRNYINMMSAPSCKVLLDAVYEPHYAHYKDDFGKTIEGFFSDEPELGNGHLYDKGIVFGSNNDFPWSDELEEELMKKYGDDLALNMILLWKNDADPEEIAKVRYAYMDAVTTLVKKDFSRQLGDWCRSHGVKYIGHLIEDNNQHARTGSSLGHYYRGLSGQDMAGIDDIGGQVFPQGEDIDLDDGPFANRMGEFYHYMLGKLASSAAAIEPLKQGNSMCEIFGAYGWSEGVRLEKYLVDHFMVRGVNHYVPHAFSAKEFPDPDCPPHFYANGNDPQYRHIGSLMAYTNRVCELISGGRHVAPVAVLYHGEGEWTGKYMFSHTIGHLLCDAQIDYDYIPQDIFAERDVYLTKIETGILKVNQQEYKAVVVPMMQYVTEAFSKAVVELVSAGVLVYFVESYPIGICDDGNFTFDESEKLKAKKAEVIIAMQKAKLISLDEVVKILEEKNVPELRITPENNRVRYYRYEQEDGCATYLFVNEGTENYRGTVTFRDDRTAYCYNAWDNCLEEVEYDGSTLKIELEPLKSFIVIMDQTISSVTEVAAYVREKNKEKGTEMELEDIWKRSICRSIDYPSFGATREIILPDNLSEEEPEFSGIVRYENVFLAEEGKRFLLEITDAYEGVEVFVNGKSLGIKVVPVYRYDLSDAVKLGKNELVIEVATTLEREMAKFPGMFGQKAEPKAFSGITGKVKLYVK